MTVLTLDEIRAYCEARSIGMEPAPVGRVYFDRCTDGCRVHVGQFGDAADAAFDTAAALLSPEREHFRGAMVWAFGRYPNFENCEAAFE